MEYLYDSKKVKTAAHIWTGHDTACRMLSTGGLRMAKRNVHPTAGGKRVCVMCQNNYVKHLLRQRVEDERQ